MISPIFEETCRNYLDQISKTDLMTRSARLGAQADGNALVIPLFNVFYRISGDGIADASGRKPNHAVSVVLCKYILHCPEKPPGEDEWASFRDFKDAAPFVPAFSTYTERAVADFFSCRAEYLRTACEQSGGVASQKACAYDVSYVFDALPKIPLILLFNDADDELPAAASVLFEKRAEKYLDMECLAILGWMLTDMLIRGNAGTFGELL